MPYIGAEPTAHHGINSYKYIASGGSQTTFPTSPGGADADGAVLSYDVGDGSCQVFLNGIKLDRSDITATNSTQVVLAACTDGDIVHVQAVKALTVGDVVAASTGGTFSGAVVAPSLTLSSTPLAVASGGSGAATHTANGVLLGAGTGAMTTAAPSTSGNVLTSNGTVWASAAAGGTEITDQFKVTGSAQANVTGDGTTYTVIFTSTEIYDAGGVFTTSTYTASATGKVHLNYMLEIGPFGSSHTRFMVKLITSNGEYTSDDVNAYVVTGGASTYNRWCGSFICDMDASDTAHVTVYSAGSSKVLDISAGRDCQFSGYLIAD